MTLGSLIHQIDRRERNFVLVLILVMVIITTLPYLYGYLNRPVGSYYTGKHAISSIDLYTYFSYFEQAKQDHFFFVDLYTSEPQPRENINLFFFAFGYLGKILGLSDLLIFHLARIILIPISLVVVYLFLTYLWKEKIRRQISFVFLLFASGVGFFASSALAKLAGGNFNELNYPLDLWVSEANFFLSLYHNPLYIAAWTLILAIFLLMLLAWENDNFKYSLAAGILALILFNIHPYNPPTVYGVLGVYLLLLIFLESKFWLYAKHYLVLLIISAPAIFYNFWLIGTNPVMRGRLLESVNLMTKPLATITGYGFLLVFALGGLIIFLRNRDWRNRKLLFIITWSATSFVLVYLDFLRLPRRLTLGLEFPLVILTTYFLFDLDRLINQRWPRFAKLLSRNLLVGIYLFIFLFTFSNLYLYSNDWIAYARRFPDYYLSGEALKVAEVIKKETPENSLILASYKTGNLIPGLTGRRVYAGHFAETIDHLRKISELDWFYSSDEETEAKYQFLRDQKIDFIIEGENERALGNFNPESKAYLKKIYQSGTENLYQVL